MKKKQPSSPDPVESHFSSCHPNLKDVYAKLMAAVTRFGPVAVESKKTSIHLCNKTAFAGVRVMSKCIALTIKSAKDLDSKRIVKHEQTSANRWHLEVRLLSSSEVDSELKKWLAEAYQISS